MPLPARRLTFQPARPEIAVSAWARRWLQVLGPAPRHKPTPRWCRICGYDYARPGVPHHACLK